MQKSQSTDSAKKIAHFMPYNDGVQPEISAIRRREDKAEIERGMERGENEIEKTFELLDQDYFEYLDYMHLTEYAKYVINADIPQDDNFDGEIVELSRVGCEEFYC